MDWLVAFFYVALAICVALIVITLVSLPKLGDERKNFVKMKAQSYTFTIVVGALLIEMIKKAYLNLWTDTPYEGMNPSTFLVVISMVYLVTLLFSKKKFGG